MSSIKLTADSGGGTFELKAPSSSGNTRVLTVPDTANGTVLTTTNPKAGNIIQVLQTVKTDTFSVTGTATADVTGLSVAITPSSTSNKILVSYNLSVAIESGGYNGFIFLLRDSTQISIKTVGVGTGAVNSQGCRDTFAIVRLDEPSTTSQITYKTQGKVNATDNSGTCRFQEGGTRSEIVLIEIEG